MIRAIFLMSFALQVPSVFAADDFTSVKAACATVDQDGGLKSRMKLTADPDNQILMRTFDTAADAFIGSIKVNCKDVEKIGVKEFRKRNVGICESRCITLQSPDEMTYGTNEITVQCPKTCSEMIQFFDGYVSGMSKGAKDCAPKTSAHPAGAATGTH